MPFPVRIQPVDFQTVEELNRCEPAKFFAKSRFKRLFERQFLRNLASEKVSAIEEPPYLKESSNDAIEFEPSSVCLDKMVQNFMEDSNEKAVQHGRNGCNCFNGYGSESSEDDLDSHSTSNLSFSGKSCELLKSLVTNQSVRERNLLADVSKIVDKNKNCKRKDENCRKIVVDGLVTLGYDAAICKSRWEKSPSYPAGEYEFVDVIIEDERLVVDMDFKSEFEVARASKTYKNVLQCLPYIFVGKADNLEMIISIVTEATKQSLKKKGLDVPPWRRAGYVKLKWLSPNVQAVRTANATATPNPGVKNSKADVVPGEKWSIAAGKGWILPVGKAKCSRSGLASVMEEDQYK